MMKLTENQKEKICKEYILKPNITQLSKEYNISRYYLSNILNKNNIKIIKKEYTTVEEKKKICEMYLSGNYKCIQIAKELNKHQSTVGKILKQYNIKVDQSKSNRKYTINEHYFDNINSEDKAYFLGLMYADGCNYPKANLIAINLQENDVEILQKFSKYVDSNKPLYYRDYSISHPTWKNQYVINLKSKHMCESLDKLGCVSKNL